MMPSLCPSFWSWPRRTLSSDRSVSRRWDRRNLISYHSPPMNKDVNKKSKEAPAEKNRPVHTIREDAISVSIWCREHQAVRYFSCTFERSYKNQDGAWKYTKTFDLDDLGTLISLCRKAQEWIVSQQRTSFTAPALLSA